MEDKLLKWGASLGVPTSLVTLLSSEWFKAGWKGAEGANLEAMSLFDVIGLMVKEGVLTPAKESVFMGMASRFGFDAKKKLAVEVPAAESAPEAEPPDRPMTVAEKHGYGRTGPSQTVRPRPRATAPEPPAPEPRPSRLPPVAARRSASVEAPAESGSGGESLLDRLKGMGSSLPIDPKYVMIAGAALVIILVLVGLVVILGGGGGTSNANPTMVPTQNPIVIVPTQAPVLIFPTPTPAPDQSDVLLAEVLNAPSPEISPWIKKSLGSPLVLAGLIMVLAIPLFAWVDAKARVKVQPFAATGALLAIGLGLFGLPLSNMAAGNAIATLFVTLILVGLWVGLLILAFAYKDWTSLSAALLLTAVTGFLAGSFALPAGLGRLVDANWLPWFGVTTVGGLMAHLMSLRFVPAAMTLFVYLVGGLAIVLAIIETGKRQGVSGMVILGFGTLVLWGVLSWLLGLGLDALVARQPMEPFTLVVLEVIRPLLAWFVSSLAMSIVGSRLGDDASINFGTNAIQLGLKGQMGIPTVADFLFVATAVGVYFTLIVRF